MGRPELQNLLAARALLVLLGLGLSPHKWRNWMRWSRRSLQAQRLSHSRIPPCSYASMTWGCSVVKQGPLGGLGMESGNGSGTQWVSRVLSEGFLYFHRVAGACTLSFAGLFSQSELPAGSPLQPPFLPGAMC